MFGGNNQNLKPLVQEVSQGFPFLRNGGRVLARIGNSLKPAEGNSDPLYILQIIQEVNQQRLFSRYFRLFLFQKRDAIIRPA